MKKIRIAFLSEHVYSLFNPIWNTPFGGGEVDLYNLAVYLAKNPQYEVTFYVGDFGQTDEIEIFENVHLKKIKMFGRHKKSSKQKATFYKNLWKTLWQSDADIILTEMASHLVGWAALFFKVLKPKHYIHRLASDKDTTHTSPSVSGSRRIYYLYRFGLKRADYVFSQTLQQQGMLKERMGMDSEIVPNGFFIDQKVEFDRKKTILWVGRCVKVKRPHLFVELAKRLPEQSFMMIMPTYSEMESEAFKQEADRYIEEAKALPNMTFSGYVPFAKIQQHYNEARLFVNTSTVEGFPNAFIQACLGGTPIASLRVDPDEFITKNELGTCCHDDFEKLVTFIGLFSDEEMVKCGENARAYVKKHHDIQLMGGKYERAIESLFLEE